MAGGVQGTNNIPCCPELLQNYGNYRMGSN